MGVRIIPFEDLTGVYEKSIERVENKSSALLDSNFIQNIVFSEPLNGFFLSTRQNPLKSVSDKDTSINVIEVRGEIERCSYEKKEDINERLLSYHFFGLFGLSGHKDSDPCGFIQIRLKLFGFDRTLIDSAIIMGVSCGDIMQQSRKELISKAISQASHNLVNELLDKLIKKYQLKVLHQSERIHWSKQERANFLNKLFATA